MRLLLAEDEKSLSKAVKAILEAGKYSVDAVFDGEEALDYLETDTYDGVILDIMMPKNLISAEKFMEKIWGFDTEADISVVWVYISYLRKKLTSLKVDIGVMEINGDENEWLSDIEGIRELLNIIFDNAVKYSTGEGNINFELKKERTYNNRSF